MIGIIGESERIQSTVISDAVNLTSRLESLTKYYGVSLIISSRTLNSLEDPEKYHARCIDNIRVFGKQQPIQVFEIFNGDQPERITKKLKAIPPFENGLMLYHQQNFAEASVQFKLVTQQDSQDIAAKLYLERAARYMIEGVPPNWAGIEALPQK